MDDDFVVLCSKSLIKLTKSRIDVIRRKRNATQRFLKEDIADLLANGLDNDAYSRVINGIPVSNLVFQYWFLLFFIRFIDAKMNEKQRNRNPLFQILDYSDTDVEDD